MEHRDALRTVVTVARRQGAIVLRRQAAERGVTSRQLRAITADGVIVRAHPGVYVLAARADDPLVRVRAAGFYLGPKAVASHGTAAWMQGLTDRVPMQVEFTVPSGSSRRYRGIRIHESYDPPAGLSYRGVRCSSPARTLVDVAPVVPAAVLDDMVDRALVQGVTRLADLAAAAQGDRRGSRLLRRSLAELGHIGAPDASRLESEMRRLLERHSLPAPTVQLRAGPEGRYRVDCAWPAAWLVAELYGYAWHHSPIQMDYDLRRQRALVRQGWCVVVFTWIDVFRRPKEVMAELADLLHPAVGTGRSPARLHEPTRKVR